MCRWFATYWICRETLDEDVLLFGPSHHVEGTRNIVGALKCAMANCGSLDLKKFQKTHMTIITNYQG